MAGLRTSTAFSRNLGRLDRVGLVARGRGRGGCRSCDEVDEEEGRGRCRRPRRWARAVRTPGAAPQRLKSSASPQSCRGGVEQEKRRRSSRSSSARSPLDPLLSLQGCRLKLADHITQDQWAAKYQEAQVRPPSSSLSTLLPHLIPTRRATGHSHPGHKARARPLVRRRLHRLHRRRPDLPLPRAAHARPRLQDQVPHRLGQARRARRAHQGREEQRHQADAQGPAIARCVPSFSSSSHPPRRARADPPLAHRGAGLGHRARSVRLWSQAATMDGRRGSYSRQVRPPLPFLYLDPAEPLLPAVPPLNHRLFRPHKKQQDVPWSGAARRCPARAWSAARCAGRPSCRTTSPTARSSRPSSSQPSITLGIAQRCVRSFGCHARPWARS